MSKKTLSKKKKSNGSQNITITPPEEGEEEEPTEVIVEPRSKSNIKKKFRFKAYSRRSKSNQSGLLKVPEAVSETSSEGPTSTGSASSAKKKSRQKSKRNKSNLETSPANSNSTVLTQANSKTSTKSRGHAPNGKHKPATSENNPEPDNSPKGTRIIPINEKIKGRFATNFVKTSKYSLVTFVPYFFYEQFRRYSNVFFLCIVLLQQIPDVSPTGRFTTLIPLIFILSVSAIKETIEDRKRHIADKETNNRLISVLRGSEWEEIMWSNVEVGDFVKVENNKMFPADLVLYGSSEPQGICYIETSNLDGETNLKVRQSLSETAKFEPSDLAKLSGFIECELPNRQLYEFVGKLRLGVQEDFPLGPDQVLLRGTKLQNTGWIYGQVVYTGAETKLLKNSTRPPLKRSTLDKLTNTQIVMLFILLVVISVVSAACSQILVDKKTMWYLPNSQEPRGTMEFFLDVLTFLILYNNLIPISLTVTLEVVRFQQATFINKDRDMYYEETGTPATARTSNLNEELGQIRYIFSDKTGTLTRNIMEFKGCTVGGELYEPDFLQKTPNPLIEKMQSGHKTANDIREFLILLAVCHSVIPEVTETGILYHAASPDDQALVYGASALGYVFENRTPNYVEITALGKPEKYDILTVLEFTSTRKRMSVITKGPDGKLRLYCKGADTMILERLSDEENSDSFKKTTQKHLDFFANQGLRTLCCGVAYLSTDEYEEWKKIFHVAATAIQDREAKVEEASNLIEKNLKLIGATAIEDKLQDLVPETIAALLEAKIHVWVLTGDKQETAINIGYSSRLLTQSMDLLVINQSTLEKTRDCINEHIERLSGGDTEGGMPEENDAAVIIDGKSLTFAIGDELRKNFIDLCCHCRSVLVCRASPMQKAEIVEYVTKETGEITLAIGDGANDVAMIQKAHVGVGISGMEGLQAANASDYAIGQFRYLTKLLFVHGAWNYDRMCKLIFYSFYKNICLYIIELWFAIYSAWSGQVIFERWTIGCYNLIFTCAQPLVMGILDRNCSKELRMKYPLLYQANKDAFNLKRFFFWIGNAIVHSILIFWFTLLVVGEGGGVLWAHGEDGGYLVLGNFIYSYVVIVVSLKAGMEIKAWSMYAHIAIWGSIIVWILFLLTYGHFWEAFPVGSDILGVGEMVFSSLVFWIGLLSIPALTLLPDVLFKAVQNSMFQSVEDKYRECEVSEKSTTPAQTVQGVPSESVKA